MRHRLIIAAIALAVPVFFLGCKEPEVVETPAPPPADPGWPALSLQDAAVQFDLQEAHYHIRKGRYTAPDSYGAEAEMPYAMGYVQWAYEMQTDNDKAMEAADHLILEQGSNLSVPAVGANRCKWCGYRLPKRMTQWPVENGQKIVECPRCTARDSFARGLVYTCPECHDVVAGTSVGSPCPTCGHQFRALQKECANCGKVVDIRSRADRKCPHCGVKWNKDIPHGTWPARAMVPVNFLGEGEGVQSEAYSAVTSFQSPDKTMLPPGEDGVVRSWIHRHQGERDAIAESGGAAAAPAGGGGGGGMGGGMDGGMGGGMGGPGMGGPGMGGPGMGGPPGGMPPGGGGGMPPGGGGGMAPGGGGGMPPGGGGGMPPGGGGMPPPPAPPSG